MKRFLFIFILIFIVLNSKATELNDKTVNLIADKIFIIEGGAKTKYPYGIKSIKTANPRAVCIKTIQNNWKRFNKQTKERNFLDFLGNIYCPVQCDKTGNFNWRRNIKKLLDKETIKKLIK